MLLKIQKKKSVKFRELEKIAGTANMKDRLCRIERRARNRKAPFMVIHDNKKQVARMVKRAA
jgi:hypothetical protein